MRANHDPRRRYALHLTQEHDVTAVHPERLDPERELEVSPSVESTLAIGRPNACNLCHLDCSLGWTAEYLERWYEIPAPGLSPEQREIAAGAARALRGDALLRALVAWSMGWEPARRASGSAWMVPYLAQLLVDPYPAVRFIAARSLRSIEGFANMAYDAAAPDEARLAVAREAMARARPERREGNAAVLMGPDGTLEHDRFSLLLRRRDDRAVLLEE